MPAAPPRSLLGWIMALDEKALFNDKPQSRVGKYQCPRCKRTHEYSVRWVQRSKKDRLPPGADAGDRAKFEKLRDYLLRLDDEVTCKACGKRFEIPSHQSLMFMDQFAGLPNDEDLDKEIAAAAGDTGPAADEPTAPTPPARKPSGWK
jgi:hypothetical protein